VDQRRGLLPPGGLWPPGFFFDIRVTSSESGSIVARLARAFCMVEHMRPRPVVTLARSDRPKAKKVQRRVWSLDGLRVRFWMSGPRWMQHFGVRVVPIADVVPADQVSWHRAGKRILLVSLEADVRELVRADQDEIRPGVRAEWSDPYEQFGVARQPVSPRRRPSG
jgi:hypothetical protein